MLALDLTLHCALPFPCHLRTNTHTTQDIGYRHTRTVMTGWMKSPSMQHLFRDPSSSTRAQRKAEGPTQEEQNLPLQLKKLSRDLATIASQIPNRTRLSLAMPKSFSSTTFPEGLASTPEGLGGYWSSPDDHDLATALDLTLQQQAGGGDVSNESSPDEGPRTHQQLAELHQIASDTTLD